MRRAEPTLGRVRQTGGAASSWRLWACPRIIGTSRGMGRAFSQAAMQRCVAHAESRLSKARNGCLVLKEATLADEVIVERAGPVQVIKINRPEAHNALNEVVSLAVASAVDELDASDKLRAGVLPGVGGNFSSGMDLKSFQNGGGPDLLGRGLCGITETRPRKPVIAAVEGWALAGGFEMLLACGPHRRGPAGEAGRARGETRADSRWQWCVAPAAPRTDGHCARAAADRWTPPSRWQIALPRTARSRSH
jgi:hypothetical protein